MKTSGLTDKNHYHNLSDKELIPLMILGDHRAYSVIYDRYSYLMHVFAYKKLRDEELAKDIVQNLFVDLWTKREKLAEMGNFTAFLYICLRRKIIDHFVHLKVENKYVDFLKGYDLWTKGKPITAYAKKNWRPTSKDRYSSFPKG